MGNPYSSPKAMSAANAELAPESGGLARFMAFYWSAFGVSVALWFLSAEVRRYDLLELPMVMFMFPLAMLFDPGDAMVGQTSSLIYGACFWAAVIPVAFRLTPSSRKRITVALSIVGVTGCVSFVFALIVAILF